MTDTRKNLADVLGINDNEQYELYSEILDYAKASKEDILSSDVSTEDTKQLVETEYKLVDEKLRGLLDFLKNHPMSEYVYRNLRKEMSDDDIEYVLDMLTDETYIKFMQSYNTSSNVYGGLIKGLIEFDTDKEGQ